MLSIFLMGIVIAFITSIPVGPVGLLCISQSIARGRRAGFIAGLGAALSDVFFAVIAAYGVTSVIDFISGYIKIFDVVSIVTLSAVGLYFLMSKPKIFQKEEGSLRDVENFFIAGFMNITNPVLIFSFFGLFTLLGISEKLHGFNSFALVAGVFIGSCLWWYLVTSVAHTFKHHMNDRTFTALNRGFGMIIFAFVIYLIFRFISEFGVI